MTVYALVHGAWHRGWHFGPLADELRRRGHAVVAPDLPCEDPDCGAEAYAATVAGALDEAGLTADPVVAVGHSLAGLTLPVLAAARPVSRMVFLAAMIPVPGRSFDSVARDFPSANPPEMGAGQERVPPRGSRWRAEPAADRFYPDAPADLAAEAASHLRAQQWTITQETCPLSAWPDVPSTYVLPTGDTVVFPHVQAMWARDLLKVEPIEIAGDHSPMLNRAVELADLLEQLP